LQRQLLAAGHPVRALQRPGSRRADALLPGVERVAVGLDDPPALQDALRGVDAVISCAGAVRGACPADFGPANVAGVANLAAAAAAQSDPPFFLHISSLAATRPTLSDYAGSKAAGEAVLRAVPGLAWCILRPPAVYGPGDKELLPLFRAMRFGLAVIVGPAEQRLSLLHVEDLARAALAVLEHRDACRGGVFGLDDGTPAGHGWPAIVAAGRGRLPVLSLHVPRVLLAALGRLNLMLARVTGHAPMLTPGKVRELSEPEWLCDNSEFHAATGWRPRVALQVGIERLFAAHSS
jgi:2-alkyl-3-oxoalkanoate reductase